MIPKMILSYTTPQKRGSVIYNKNGVPHECLYYDSKDTILKNHKTGKTKMYRTQYLHRYFERKENG